MSFLNDWARRSFECAIRRGKTKVGISHKEMFDGINEEMQELKKAKRRNDSEHIPGLDEEAEELVDVMICCMTELYNRGVNVEAALWSKLTFNDSRK